MAGNVEDPFFDFDINFLSQSSANPEAHTKLEKYRKSILVLKKKVVSANSLIRKYYAKREQLEQSEKNLFESKEECKKICIDYRNALENCTKLENDLQILQSRNKELEEKYFKAENQCIGIQSHANQLQQLVVQHESQIEVLKLEHNLCKSNVKTNDKASEKQVRGLRNKIKTLHRHISLFKDIILDKRKLKSKHKLILQRYEDYDGSSESGGETGDHDDYLFSPPSSPIHMGDDPVEPNAEKISKIELSSSEINHIQISDSNDILEISKTNENDGSSVDTGRGSSLACSDSEKIIHSPSYFLNDSPLSDSSPHRRHEKHSIDVATSPIFILETAQVSTSPISFDNSSFSNAFNEEQSKVAKLTTGTVLVNTISDCLTAERSASLVETNKCVRSIFSPSRESVGAETVGRNNTSEMITKTNHEKACLERNNSNNLFEENSNDCEIETILRSMRLNYNLITPIPISPAKSTRQSTCRSITANQQTETQNHHVYSDTMELKEDNKKLHASIADLAKEVMNIKNLLQNQVLPQRNLVYSTTALDLDGDTMMFSDGIGTLHETTRPSSAQTAIIEHKEQSMIRYPSPCTRDTYIICETDELSTESPIMVIEAEEENLVLEEEVPVSSKGLRLEFEESTLFPVEFHTPANTDSIIDEPSTISEITDNYGPVNVPMRPNRRRNLSKLSLLKNKMIPKSKIKRDFRLTQKRKRLRPKPIIMKKKRKVLDTDNSASLNEKSIYEKAVHVMSVIKDKQSTDPITTKKIIDTVELNNSTQTSNILDLINEIESRPKLTMPKSVTIKNNNTCLSKSQTVDNICNDQSKFTSSFVNNNKDHISNEAEDINETTNSLHTSHKVDHANDTEFKQKSMQPKNIYDEQNKTHSKNMDDKDHDISIQNSNNDILDHEYFQTNKTPNSLHANTILDLINDIESRPKIIAPKFIHAVNNTSKTLGVQNSNKDKIKNESEVINKTHKSTRTGQILDVINEIESRPISTTPKNTLIENYRTHSKDVDVVNIMGSNKSQPLKGILKNSNNNKLHNEDVDVNKTLKEYCNREPNETLTVSSNKRRVTRSSTKNIFEEERRNDSEKIYVEILDKSQNVNGDKNNLERRKSLKRQSQDGEKLETPSKRVLRSSTSHTNNSDVKDETPVEIRTEKEMSPNHNKTHKSRQKDNPKQESGKNCNDVINYNDIDMFSDGKHCLGGSQDTNNYDNNNQERSGNDYENNILCTMLNKYGVRKIKFHKKKVSDNIQDLVSEKLEKDIGKIIELPAEEAKRAMDDFIVEIRKYTYKEFIYGLIKYLQDPTRKTELFKKVMTPPAPPMSKSEQVLLYIITQLRHSWKSIDFVDSVMRSIEYALFSINRTPEFNVIESMSHFYAVLCRYFKAKRRLRLFIMDAMYCLQFKSVTLIKQCVEVWMHVLPLAHMGVAKTPLVTCLVYLLHFYKCEDKFNRVSEIRSILSRKYFFNITDWNEITILEMFRTAIMELKYNDLESKTLRIAIIILGKRMGPKWCQKNVINNLLKPIIEKSNIRENIRVFCIAMLGPLLKPYPVEMKVHCEIITNELVDMLHKPAPRAVQEAVATSLLCLVKHNQHHVVHALLHWKPKQISPQLEDMLRTYIRSKPAKTWKSILSNIPK